MKEVVIVAGLRTPFVKAGGAFKNLPAYDLTARLIRELMLRLDFPSDKIEEVIIGNVIQSVESANMARISAVLGGLPNHIPAYTVNRNCASGMEAISQGFDKIRHGQAKIILAGGAESMSSIPIFSYSPELTDILMGASKAKTAAQRLQILSQLRPQHLKPGVINQNDPIADMTMGQTAENLVRDFGLTRQEQDEFSLRSHQLAVAARPKLAEEILPILIPDGGKGEAVLDDIGPREDSKLESLLKLRPVFDKDFGSVTAGNASPITDGAAIVLMMDVETAQEMGLEPLGYIRSYAYAGLEAQRMGLGPSYATPKALAQGKIKFSEIELIEINEAFAAQVIANERAFASSDFAEKIGLKAPLGEINRDILNVNGGAIALGHPLGASGARLILTLLKEMGRRGNSLGLASLCIGGGQGASFILERK
ncbi:acetyl-CoA C-acyltransferase [bacterium (Candidatus Blackallbacteria) CG17_big_fil_post_rev_8_21_14_2_50_48_46]|uniref:Acetyl-CoA C-acyltransferase n=1 Tax=bacterium (Candidatus Blackallbacteria) CG17_big_fil_post_rev_8_21_14_2_50_48_46 TaxID=2014261 RepID=A0A2M7G606_9BACT|nr:MAG: acetyl-CoA C-acyltransferase [bacterium (Candidatus Blackallbacteria) CG18_big_fil_WC_8_21_14_2_50_49_26]PIW17458.1 MAG: acetyl-CoA C-acyltransferase [bacterium (Candidatus Blackallbacteria) CG17_big_fil_post_rev_8_21_14_2_50_48_46]PIW48312.1 MAG: acetyl-CoA C-acyltransferase [bacterium (Candidatus Blackallbacteria) CG13_big_fil_rev_8_21_14_2_50_49_14]